MSVKRFVLPLVILLVIFDQITKIKLASSCNAGVAFSLFQNVGIVNFVAPVFIVIAIFYLLLKVKSKIFILSLAIIIGGGVSNLIDRLFLGCVRDFISVGFWPSFNLADSAVTVGVGVLMLKILFGLGGGGNEHTDSI